MTQAAADAQMRALEKTYQKAIKSKASALKFLKDAGIITRRKRKTKTKSIRKKI